MARSTRRVVKTPAAVVDLIEIGDYLARAASITIADRFIAAAETTFNQLAKAPSMGARYDPDDPAFKSLRYGLVSQFRNYVVFYRPLRDGIEVIRVLHGARDFGSILETGAEE